MTHPSHETNRLSWNAATVAHNSHKGDQATFLRGGGSTLFPEEIELLGPLEGRTLLHLQCNSGQDTLSLVALGARVTGVDISDEAVAFARRLAEESGIPGEFDRADVYEWLAAESAEGGRRFDVVFASYGAVCWLSDLRTWARGIAGVLAAGGRFVLVEFHPVAAMFDDQGRHAFPYSTAGEPIESHEGVGDYVAASGAGLLHGGEFQEGVTDFQNPHRAVEYAWGVAEVVTALVDAGLALEALREWPYANGCAFFQNMRLEGRRMHPPEGMPAVPLMYGIAAREARGVTAG